MSFVARVSSEYDRPIGPALGAHDAQYTLGNEATGGSRSGERLISSGRELGQAPQSATGEQARPRSVATDTTRLDQPQHRPDPKANLACYPADAHAL